MSTELEAGENKYAIALVSSTCMYTRETRTELGWSPPSYSKEREPQVRLRPPRASPCMFEHRPPLSRQISWTVQAASTRL